MEGDIVLGIDPGNFGALAWVTGGGHLIDVADMPLLLVRERKSPSPLVIRQFMQLRPLSYVIIEEAVHMPERDAEGEIRSQGGAGLLRKGEGFGLLRGIAIGLGIPCEVIHPRSWKSRAGVPSDKVKARAMATALWPGAAKRFVHKRDDGRADAALLGRWAALR